jgi:hypothetical protein
MIFNRLVSTLTTAASSYQHLSYMEEALKKLKREQRVNGSVLWPIGLLGTPLLFTHAGYIIDVNRLET